MASVLRFVVLRWLPPTVDRPSILSTALAASGTGRRMVVEIFSLIALGFRLRCREATNDNPRRIAVRGAALGLTVTGLLFVGEFLGVPITGVRLVAVIAPGVMLAAGWFDPRLAIATLVVWGSRLLVLDHASFVDDLQRLGSDLTPSTLLLRWTAMAAGVIVAAAVSHEAVRQSARL